jgi:hypothetical protein
MGFEAEDQLPHAHTTAAYISRLRMVVPLHILTVKPDVFHQSKIEIMA